MVRPHSLIFIRENEGQLTGSNCCGKLEGDWRYDNGVHIFEEQRGVISKLAPLFLIVKRRWPEQFEVQQVDPRNQLFLIPKILADILRAKKFSMSSLRSLLMLYRLPAIILDGELLFSGRVPAESEFFAKFNFDSRLD